MSVFLSTYVFNCLANLNMLKKKKKMLNKQEKKLKNWKVLTQICLKKAWIFIGKV